jgi:hypothetical protein
MNNNVVTKVAAKVAAKVAVTTCVTAGLLLTGVSGVAAAATARPRDRYPSTSTWSCPC